MMTELESDNSLPARSPLTGIVRTLLVNWPFLLTILLILLLFHQLKPPAPLAISPLVSDSMESRCRGLTHDYLASYADALHVWAAYLRKGEANREAAATASVKWSSARAQAFDSRFRADLDAIIPSGTEPTDSQRKAYAAYLEKIAAEVRRQLK